MNSEPSAAPPPAPLTRRLLAMLYDSLLLIAVLFLAMALLLLILRGHSPGNPWSSLYLLLVSFGFFGGFWTHGGQTLGMRAWKIRLVGTDGRPLGWRQAALRFVTGLPAWIVLLIGIALSSGIPLHSHAWLEWLARWPGEVILLLGVLWVIADQWPDGWRDRLSDSRVIRID